jgi:hypothetical protein
MNKNEFQYPKTLEIFEETFTVPINGTDSSLVRLGTVLKTMVRAPSIYRVRKKLVLSMWCAPRAKNFLGAVHCADDADYSRETITLWILRLITE